MANLITGFLLLFLIKSRSKQDRFDAAEADAHPNDRPEKIYQGSMRAEVKIKGKLKT